MSELPGQPTRQGHHEPGTAGERIADAIARLIGSWRFIIAQSVLVAAWVAANAAALALRWDPYPFVLLNLMFSVQAAYTGPILLLASNRQAQRDRAVAERDDLEIGEIREINRELIELQREQTELTRAIHAHIEREGPAS